MKKPSPFIPQGSLLENSSANQNHLRIAFFIVAIHLVFFGGLLMQGCKKDAGIASDSEVGADEEIAAVRGEYPALPDNYYNSVDDIGSVTNGSPNDPNSQVGMSDLSNVPDAGGGANSLYGGGSDVGNEPTLSGSGQTNTIPNFFGVSDASESEYNSGGAGSGTGTTIGGGSMREHIIAKNDSFYKLGRLYGVSTAAIQAANPGVNPRRIKLGQTILIPPAETAKPGQDSAEPAGSFYVVKKNDTLTEIAAKHGTSVKLLMAMNNLRTDRILVGQKLVIPEDDENSVPTSSVGYVQPTPGAP